MKGAAARPGEIWPKLRDPGRAARASSISLRRLSLCLYALLPSLSFASPPMGTRRPFGVSVSHLYRHLVRSVAVRLTDSLIPAKRASLVAQFAVSSLYVQ